MNKLKEILPQWINPKAFLIFSILTLAQQSKTFKGWGLESVITIFVETIVGGFFWGWLFTKFLPKYFPPSTSKREHG